MFRYSVHSLFISCFIYVVWLYLCISLVRYVVRYAWLSSFGLSSVRSSVLSSVVSLVI